MDKYITQPQFILNMLPGNVHHMKSLKYNLNVKAVDVRKGKQCDPTISGTQNRLNSSHKI